jgi:hypothetical protein
VTTINAADNPTLINSMVAKMLAEDEPETPVVTATELPDTFVTLSSGYINFKGELITEGEVRELNGEDEEYISKTQGTGKFLSAILQRGVVRVGEEKPSTAVLDALLSGDRDELLLGIRRATFGDTVTVKAVCQHCGEEQEAEVDLKADVPRKVMLNPQDRVFEVACSVGMVETTLPTGAVQRKILDSVDKTNSELNTSLLEACVQEINGMPVMGAAHVRSLSIRDREKILTAITERVTGPRLSEIKKPCAACDKDMDLPFAMAALFRL